MSSLMSKGSVQDRRIRDEMLSRSQHYRVGSKKPMKRHFKDVLRVKSCETKDHAVDYDAMLQKQIASFRDINSIERLEEVIQVDFGRNSKAPIKEVNLNKSLKPCRHYFRHQKFKEFIVYSIEFENMKRVLTLRTQYLLVNKTLHDYQIKIINQFNKEQFEIKMLKAGNFLPLPETYN